MGEYKKTVLITLLLAAFMFPQSLWDNNQGSPYGPVIARKVGDILLIEIDESSTAVQTAETDLEKNSELTGETKLSWSQAANLIGTNRTNDRQGQSGLSMRRNFKGSGSTERSSRLQAQLTAQVYKTDGNLLYIRGSKRVVINNEQEQLTMEGVIRREDIQEDNTIMSSQISDAVLKIKGYGHVSNEQEKGFLTRMFDWLF